MSQEVVWLFLFGAVYAAYCLVAGWRGARAARTADDYFIAGRGLSRWAFVLAATATSFAGWVFLGHPALILSDGFPFGYASFLAIAIPFTGVLFLKRQWMLGKRFGYLTPGEMLSDYFRGDAIRILTVVVALAFAIPFLGIQLGASGYLVDAVTDGLIGRDLATWALALVVVIYAASGGLRGVAYAGALQCILMAAGIVIMGGFALDAAGGWDAVQAGLSELAVSRDGSTTGGRGGGDYNAYFAIPGVIQFTAGLGREAPMGGLWTGVMCLTFLFALMGVQASPAFSMWSFSARDPGSFAPQQVWASSLVAGLVLFFFATLQGIGGRLLGDVPTASDTLLALADEVGLAADDGGPGAVAYLHLDMITEIAPWVGGLLAISALAAMQSTAAAHASAAGGMLARDLHRRYLDPAAPDQTQKRIGRLGVAAVAIAALLLVTYARESLVLLGGLALAFGFQMWIPLAAVTWVPWVTRQGVTWGLACGMLGVIFTDRLGVAVLEALDLASWGRWPWTIHSAGWGMMVNLAVCVVVSALTQNPRDTGHRARYHAYLREHAGLSQDKRKLIPIAWVVTVAWLFFGVGPGAVIGNDVFGAPDMGAAGWTFGIPSIWAWQILLWLLGVALMWFLAYRMEMSTAPEGPIAPLADDAARGTRTTGAPES